MTGLHDITGLARQFVVFCGVGAINTVLSLIVILVLLEVFHLHYMLSNFLGYAFGLGVGFVLHSRITFKPGEEGKAHPFGHIRFFTVVFGVAYASQLAFLYYLVEVAHLDDALSQVLAVGMYTALNFIGNKYWTFR